MSASERLRALDGAMTPGPWVTGSKVGFPVSDVIALRNALPLIADVVEAAERDEYLEDVDIPEVIDHYTPLSVTVTRSVKEWRRLKSDRAALTALREHLEGGDVT